MYMSYTCTHMYVHIFVLTCYVDTPHLDTSQEVRMLLTISEKENSYISIDTLYTWTLHDIQYTIAMYICITLYFYSYPHSYMYTYRLIGLSPTLITCVSSCYHNGFHLCCHGNDTSHIK